MSVIEKSYIAEEKNEEERKEKQWNGLCSLCGKDLEAWQDDSYMCERCEDDEIKALQRVDRRCLEDIEALPQLEAMSKVRIPSEVTREDWKEFGSTQFLMDETKNN